MCSLSPVGWMHVNLANTTLWKQASPQYSKTPSKAQGNNFPPQNQQFSPLQMDITTVIPWYVLGTTDSCVSNRRERRDVQPNPDMHSATSWYLSDGLQRCGPVGREGLEDIWQHLGKFVAERLLQHIFVVLHRGHVALLIRRGGLLQPHLQEATPLLLSFFESAVFVLTQQRCTRCWPCSQKYVKITCKTKLNSGGACGVRSPVLECARSTIVFACSSASFGRFVSLQTVTRYLLFTPCASYAMFVVGRRAVGR